MATAPPLDAPFGGFLIPKDSPHACRRIGRVEVGGGTSPEKGGEFEKKEIWLSPKKGLKGEIKNGVGQSERGDACRGTRRRGAKNPRRSVAA